MNSYEMQQEDLDKVVEQRDALAAHVERMCDVWQRLHLKSPDHVEVLKAYSYVMRDTPTNSLARLKAQWQAEVLERYAEGIARDNEPTDMVCVEDVHTLLLHEAAELRQQAEEG